MMLNKKTIISLSLGVAIALVSSGCATKDTSGLVDSKNQEIENLQNQLKNKNSEIMTNEEEIRKLKENKSDISNSLIPPNALPGECYAKVLVPPVYETKTKTKLVKSETSEIVITPATYKTEEKKVTIREASTRIEIIPAVYKTITEEVLVTPEHTKLVVVPATYKTVTEELLVTGEKVELVSIPETYKKESEEVLITPAHTKWKKGRGEIEKVNHSTGEIMCLIEVPAVYETITRTVLDRQAYTEEVVTPAVYKTVKRVEVDVPAHTEEQIIEAVFKTIEHEELVTPEIERIVDVPAICKMVKSQVLDIPATHDTIVHPSVYTDYETSVKTKDSYLRWQKTLCETNTKKDIVSDLQRVLRGKGYDVRNIDGVYSTETKNAVNKYQRENNLSTGALTLKTLESLGL